MTQANEEVTYPLQIVNIHTTQDLKAEGIVSMGRLDHEYVEIQTDTKRSVRKYRVRKDGTTARVHWEGKKLLVRDFFTFVPETEREERLVEIDLSMAKPKKVKYEKVRHAKYSTIKTCIENDIPVYLVGDAGTGKNHTLQEVAEDMGLDFYFTNSVQQEYKITGFIDAGGVYHETEFYKAFLNGGLFFLDEIDASIPEVLVLLNAAIANRYFEFPNGKVNAHPDFRVVAAGNTVGSGANELYTGRLVLDSATLDRFVVIEFDYDREIEIMLAKGNILLVNFIRSLREFCKKQGIRGTFSYRMITAVCKLEEAGLPLWEIIEIAVVKGLDKDTIKQLKVDSSGKYYFALQKLQLGNR